MSVDIYLLLGQKPTKACSEGIPDTMLRTLDGVKDVEKRELQGRPLLRVVYDPQIGSSAVILKAMEQIGCRASLIGL